MKITNISKMPFYYDRYIQNLGDVTLFEALDNFGIDALNSFKNQFHTLGNQVYAPGKWTVKDILQHIIDGERIFSYRALCIARNDKTHFPEYDENAYANEASTTNRTIDELVEEFTFLRKSSICLFKSLDETQLLRTGICANKEISVLAIGFVLAGHFHHHISVIQEKYLSLLNK
jgi:hypothetical protein